MEEIFEKHREFLVDRIDPDFGLLDKLLASRTLTREALHRIKLKDNTIEDKNRIVLDFVLKNKKAKELVSALADSGQIHLVNYLNADGGDGSAFGDDWPLSESDISRLEINRECLVELLDMSKLCIRLFSEKVINNRQRQLICSKPTDAEKNEALLDILTKCSIRKYKMTIACLNDSNQSHIADILSDGGVVIGVHANIEGALENVDEMEDQILSQMTKILGDRPMGEVSRLMEMTQLRIIAARKGHSVVIYFHCIMHDDLLRLFDLIRTEELERVVGRVFAELLSVGDALNVTLTWSQEEFRRSAAYFESEVSFDSTPHSKEGKEKRPIKLPNVGKWVRKRFSKTKRSLDESGIAERNLQEAGDSVDLSLGRGLSTLTVANRPLPAELVEESRLGDIKLWLSGQQSPRSSLRSTRLSIYSGHSSGYMSHSSTLAISKGLSSSTLSDEPEAFERRLRLGLATSGELPWMYTTERSERYSPHQDIESAHETTDKTEQLIELQQERQKDKAKIEELETELYDQRRKIADLLEERRRLREELEENKRKFDELKEKMEGKQTEQTATHAANKVDYKEDPVLIKTIRTKAAEEDMKGISGLAIADHELFMTSFQTNDIEVYDLKSLTLNGSWRLEPLINPYDLGYCNVNKCLYMMDITYIDYDKKIFRVDRNGKVLKSWTTGMDYGCISVTYDCNIVMVALEGYTITEYTPDGQIVREMKLSTRAGFAHPRHAIKLNNGRFLISHGDEGDPLHRVCVVDTNGDIRMSFGGQCGSTSDRLFVPIPLAIDSSGSIIVVDRDNSRVVLLSSSLEFMREIISPEKEGMRRPERIAVDQANGRLLVAHNDPAWSECRVFVFEIL